MVDLKGSAEKVRRLFYYKTENSKIHIDNCVYIVYISIYTVDARR